jgi:hypothetical protein
MLLGLLGLLVLLVLLVLLLVLLVLLEHSFIFLFFLGGGGGGGGGGGVLEVVGPPRSARGLKLKNSVTSDRPPPLIQRDTNTRPALDC